MPQYRVTYYFTIANVSPIPDKIENEEIAEEKCSDGKTIAHKSDNPQNKQINSTTQQCGNNILELDTNSSVDMEK